MHRRATLISTAVITLALLPAGAAAVTERALPPAGEEAPAAHSPDGLIVRWEPLSSPGERGEARLDANVRSRANLGRSYQLVAVEKGQAPEEAIAALRADPAVQVVERDGYDVLHGVPNDPLFGQLWGLRNLGLGVIGFDGAVAGADIDAVAAWDRTIGAPSIVVADIDSGYRFEHPDLGPVAWINPGEIAGNGNDDDGNGIVDDVHGADFIGANGEAPSQDGDPTDDDLISGGHGVHTAGTIGAAGNNGTGITGVARNARIMPLRACTRFPVEEKSACPASAQVMAINYARTKGARVVNMSLGSNTFRQTVVNAIAESPGMLFVISAGNDGGNNDGGEAAPKGHHYPCDYRPTVDASPAVPGAIDNIVCVAATNQADDLASFSDWGPISVDLAAPGTEILSAYPYAWPIEEGFEVEDFASKWDATGANGGFGRSNESPLTSYGITDSPGAAPVPSSVRESASVAVPIPAGLAPCTLYQTRTVSKGATGSYRYEVRLNGSAVAASEPGSGSGRFNLALGSKLVAGGNVSLRFRYSAGDSPASGDGAWVDDLLLACAQTVGTGTGFAFLQGTSMAAPHVSGTAALLFSLRPSASVAQVRSALITSGDPRASLSGKTVSGRRLDASAALAALVPVGSETVAPETAILSGPEGTTDSGAASFAFARTDADAGAFECSLDGAPFSACASPASFAVAPGGHQFRVRAKVPSGLVDPTPASRSWAVSSPPAATTTTAATASADSPSAPWQCRVPKVKGLVLARAKLALRAAGCRVGRVRKPRPRKGGKRPALVVKSSTPAAGASSAAAVSLKLGPKRKKNEKKTRKKS